MKFKENVIKPGMVIHCPKEEDARALLMYLNLKSNYWWETGEYLDNFNMLNRLHSFYKGNRFVSLEIGFRKDDLSRTVKMTSEIPTEGITEFSDLIELETLSGKEVIEWFDKYSREIESMPELFPNCKTITDVVEWYTPECIMEKMVWYEKHKKIEPENSTGREKSTEMSVEEILEWLIKKHYEDNVFDTVFGVSYFDELVDKYDVEKIIDKITAYEAAKKEQERQKQIKTKWVDICRIIKVKDNGIKECVYEEDISNTPTDDDFKGICEDILKKYVSEHEGNYFVSTVRNCIIDDVND